jgi:uncharacterized protein YndB with AHSA1/START domain
MRWKAWFGAACLVGLHAAQVSAQTGTGAVVDSSFRLPDGERVMELSVHVPAPIEDVWRAFTTSEGFASWAARVARVDLRVGGEYETSYDPKAQVGAPGNIRNQIVTLVPLRLVVIRNVQAPPVTAFDVPTFQTLQTAVHFQRVDTRLTRVVLQNPGYRDGEKFDGVYTHFWTSFANDTPAPRHDDARVPRHPRPMTGAAALA